MSPIFRNITMAYLIFLSIVLGASLYAGIVVAPVIFHTEAIFDSPILSQFQEGMIMTENFVRLSYVITLSVIVAFVYESYKYKKGERDLLTFVALFLVITTKLMFSYYYLPEIILMQQVGEEMTKTQLFLDTHKGSEVNFKIYAFALLLLLIRNFQKALR
ncbi:MAG: DUF4149 domain-containing protein [Sulfurovaceae bacterium]|nr:DUF4149 domain-containing protein [Sulfurovaceae bacterium]